MCVDGGVKCLLVAVDQSRFYRGSTVPLLMLLRRGEGRRVEQKGQHKLDRFSLSRKATSNRQAFCKKKKREEKMKVF